MSADYAVDLGHQAMYDPLRRLDALTSVGTDMATRVVFPNPILFSVGPIHSSSSSSSAFYPFGSGNRIFNLHVLRYCALELFFPSG